MAIRYAAIVPCYNVGSVCVSLLMHVLPLSDVCIAIDDGSTDDTPEKLKGLEIAGLQTVFHEQNHGKGTALVSGFRLALQLFPPIDAFITLDSDGQHDPSLIPRFQQEYERTNADLICGYREFDAKRVPYHRRMLNGLSNKTLSWLCGRKILDSQSGYRLYSRRFLEDQIETLQTGRYELETELLLKACRTGFQIAHVPISTIYSKETMNLSHHSAADVLRIAKLVVRNAWRTGRIT